MVGKVVAGELPYPDDDVPDPAHYACLTIAKSGRHGGDPPDVEIRVHPAVFKRCIKHRGGHHKRDLYPYCGIPPTTVHI